MAHRVLILGGGFGGLTAARKLERITPPASTQITLVNDVNFMLYTPLLPAAAGGTLEPRHVVVPLREQLRNTELVLGKVTGADPTKRRVTVRMIEAGERELAYDQLIVALGSTSRTFPVPGLKEHALGFKTLSEAIALRDHLIQTLERAEVAESEEERHSLLCYVMVGAGYAGLEGLAELQDFAADVLPLYPKSRLHGLRFILVEALPRVMKEVPEELAEFATAELRKRGIEVRTSTTVERVSADSIELSDGEVVPCQSVCWTTGVMPHPVVAKLGLPRDKTGRIVCDRYGQVQGFSDVWAIGDAAAIPDPVDLTRPSPPTAQHALRQGRVVATNVANAFGDGRKKPFSFKTLGVFVDMGRRQAVAQTLGLTWRGVPAWVLARGYHIAAMPGWKRRGQLMVSWTAGLVLGRDSSELGQLGHPPQLEMEEFEPISVGGTTDTPERETAEHPS